MSEAPGRVPPGAALDQQLCAFFEIVMAMQGANDHHYLVRRAQEFLDLLRTRSALDAQPPQAPQKEQWQPIDLEAIKSRERKATSGPWEQHGQIGTHAINGKCCGEWTRVVGGDTDGHGEAFGKSGILRFHDAEFIAHARQDIPDLLAEVERLRVIDHRSPTEREIQRTREFGRERTVCASFHQHPVCLLLCERCLHPLAAHTKQAADRQASDDQADKPTTDARSTQRVTTTATDGPLTAERPRHNPPPVAERRRAQEHPQ